MRRLFSLLLVSAASASCAPRTLVLVECPPDLLADGTCNAAEDAAAPAATWPDHVATLGAPSCPAGATLIVNGTGAELDGGDTLAAPEDAGATLSLREALFIAANRDGQDNVFFDPAVFPPAAPTEIGLGPDAVLPMFIADVCIDGRGAWPVVRWTDDPGDGSIPECVSCSLSLSTGLLVGMTFLRTPFEIELWEMKVAGCRFNFDGETAYPSGRFWSADLYADADFGPGNVVAGAPIRTWSGTVLHDSFFGFDPVTGRTSPMQSAVDLRGPQTITGNVFVAVYPLQLWEPNGNHTLDISDNDFRDGPGASMTAIRLTGATAVIGPRNRIHGFDVGIELGAPTHAIVTQNSLTANGVALSFETLPAVSAPTLVSVEGATVRATCASAGVIELFADPADQGELYLSSAACSPGPEARLDIPLDFDATRLRFLTATLTSGDAGTSSFSSALALDGR